MLGMVFGVARGALVVAILVLLARATPLPQDPWWRDSVLLGHFDRIAEWLLDFLPADQAAWFRQR
jgi:membrane protein required for colicin V production